MVLVDPAAASCPCHQEGSPQAGGAGGTLAKERGSLCLRSSTEPHGCVWQDLEHGDCGQQQKNLGLCLLWPYGHINANISACRLQSLVGLTP